MEKREKNVEKENKRGEKRAATEEGSFKAKEGDSNATDELKSCQEQLLRARADYANLLKRLEREVKENRRALLREVFSSLVPAIDSLRMASKHGEKGVAAVMKQLEYGFRQFGITLIAESEIGKKFDPERHEAVAKDGEGEIVKEVVSVGAEYEGNVLVHAKVVVGGK